MRIAMLLSLLLLLCSSCGDGYRKRHGQWAWVTIGPSFNKTVNWIYPVDKKTFKVLSDERYAKDKDHVFYMGRMIEYADPKTFQLLERHGYAKDKNSAFLDCEKVIFADPASFEVLEFPYARDAKHVFCGTLPMNMSWQESREFTVLNPDKMMSGAKSTTLLSYFIEFNPEYAWLDTLGIKFVITGPWGSGKTSRRKFKGFQEVD